MARSTYDVKEQYLGTGSLADYTFSFKIEALSQLLVIEYNASGVQTNKVRGDDVTYLSGVDFDPVAGAGTVHLAANLTNNYTLVLLLANDAPTQPSEFKNKADFTLKRIEAALDFIVGSVQRLAYRSARSVQLNDFDDETLFDPTLPVGMPGTASKIPTTNAAGTGWASVALWTPLTDLTTAVASAAAAATSAAAAAGSAVSAAASAAAAVVSAAAANTSALNAAGSATAAAGSATAAAASAAVAAASATGASGSASAAATSAAAALASQGAAAASATAAASSATAAAASASAAATSASGAATSATNAATSETNAAASAVAAALSAASASSSGGIPAITGTRAAPQSITAAGGIAFTGTYYYNTWFIKGNAAPIDITVNPQIAAGTNVGQRLMLIGRDDTNTVQLDDGTGVVLAGGGSLFFFANTIAEFVWDGTNWVQIA